MCRLDTETESLRGFETRPQGFQKPRRDEVEASNRLKKGGQFIDQLPVDRAAWTVPKKRN